ncbi:Oidioi.mRNA.OKI2018_I69.chr2.g4076.t1.cds [Oikopleura dioica]|uniref:Oidioi.mRNA.OKI2018_I69.chr2.g4076.t1.cds n=1 Tax=Oikopleura dioica TaxID=34765 RepID=A0ABN7T2V6_OIKDI|nr:Oidioi.mRNA.OKI2018_I69.chr2.g4076.t1.cds [Oikopleura dioica]
MENKNEKKRARKVTLIEKLRDRKNDGRRMKYNDRWIFDHNFRFQKAHETNQLMFEEISFTQSTMKPTSDILVIGTTCGRLNLMKTTRFDKPSFCARVNISPTEEGSICSNLYYHRWDPTALCFNRKIDLTSFSQCRLNFMASSVSPDGNLGLLAGYAGVYSLDFRSGNDIIDLSHGAQQENRQRVYPPKINSVKFSRSGALFAITHENEKRQNAMSVYDLRNYMRPLYTAQVEDSLDASYPNSIFWGPSDDYISFTSLCKYECNSWARVRLQGRFASKTPNIFFYRKKSDKDELEQFDSIELGFWGKDSLGDFEQRVKLLGKDFFSITGSRSTQIYRLSDRTLFQDLKQGKHKDRICGIEYVEGDRSLITYDDLGDIFRWKKTIESVADLTSYS